MRIIKSKAALFIPGLLLIALIACGSDDPAPVPPAALPAVTLADGLTVEPGSDEAEIVSLSERMITNLRIRDIEAFRADCDPDVQARYSVDELAALIEEDSNRDYGQPAGVSLYGSEMNLVIHDFRKFRDTLTIKLDQREGEDVITADLGVLFEKVGGRWYMSSNLCPS